MSEEKIRLTVSGVRIAISPEIGEDKRYIITSDKVFDSAMAAKHPLSDEERELLDIPHVDEVGSYGGQDPTIFAQFDGLDEYYSDIGQVMTGIYQIVHKYHQTVRKGGDER